MRLRTSLVSVLVATMTLVGGTSLATDEHDAHHSTPQDPKADWEGLQPAAAPGTQSSAPSWSERPDRFAPCVRGTAYLPEYDGHPVLGSGAFACNRVDLMSVLTVDELGGGFSAAPEQGRGSGMWGWTDPQTRREYVLAGKSNGTAIVDITDPKRPVYLAELPTSQPATDTWRIWREIWTYADHAYVVSEAGPPSFQHGMQVLDLTRLRGIDPTDAPVTLEADAVYRGFESAHNIFINEDTGFGYAVGARNLDRSLNCAGGLHMLDLSDPVDPQFAGCFGDEGYTHDVQCVVYAGPDTRFTGREICFASSPHVMLDDEHEVNAVSIIDVTDKANPTLLGRSVYEPARFSHQGWLTEDQRYWLHGDELLHNPPALPRGTYIIDMADLTSPQQIGFYESVAQSTDHNMFTKGRYLYQSNYSSGLRILDLRNVADANLKEVAFFDVYPPHDAPGFGFGTWNNYPYFDSGVVAIHGYQGLWLVKPRLGERRP